MVESKLQLLKKNYLEIEKKYKLPEFDVLNRDFPIEKIAENETDILIREIRRIVGDKLANYMRFIENLLNPVNVPMFVLLMVKTLNESDKKQLSGIYGKLIKVEIKFIELDIEFSEKKEAEFIKNSFNLWQNIKKDILSLIQKIDKKSDDKIPQGNKGYFG